MSQYKVEIRSEDDIFVSLHYVKLLMSQVSYSAMDQQKILVTVSELTRNILDHAGAAGSFQCEIVEDRGIRITVRDRGGGFHESNKPRGLGLGLAGAKRMMDEFTIQTSSEGTEIVCTKWNSRPS